MQAAAQNPLVQAIENELCRRDFFYWVDNWVWTFNPKNATKAMPALLPFDLFPRQRELAMFIDDRLAAQEDGLVDKSREMGFTWVCAAKASHKWLYVDGFKTTFGSRKAELVDKIGDPDSIFEKVRILLRYLPPWMKPRGYKPRLHDKEMLLINPKNENTIRGEAGDEMGRGGRSSLYVVDEAAFLERAERVDASTSANVETRIWGSTVNGPGGMFARKRHDGSMRPDQIFTMHYSMDPRPETPARIARMKAKLEPHTFASEYEIDYSASVEGICIPGHHVTSATQILDLLQNNKRGIKIKLEPSAQGIAGLDVGAGKAKSVCVVRFGPIVTMPNSWGDPDTIETAHRALDHVQATTLERSDGRKCIAKQLRFDEVGVGKGVLSALSHHKRKGITTTPINVGVAPSDDTVWPDGLTSKEKFTNLKADIAWIAREFFKNTHEMALWLMKEPGGIEHKVTELISIPRAATTLIAQLSCFKWFRSEKGQIQIESKDELKKRGIASPDEWEALSLTFVPDSGLEDWLGAFGNE
jgi:phage terminase large subunit